MSKKPKILLFDVETAPKMGYVWSLWKQNIGLSQLVSDVYMLCWAAKWLDDEHIYTDSLHYHTKFNKEPENDKKIVESIWKMLDEADIVIGHNGDNFDIKTVNQRFVVHGMKPPSSFKSMDTLKMAKNYFKFTSNRLDALGKALGVGRKMDTGGFELWRAIIQDKDLEQFDKMVAYNEQDVYLLEDVYKKLRPWDKRHINMALNDLEVKSCNICGGDVRKHGTYSTNTFTYQRYICKDCGATSRSRKAEKLNKDQKDNILRGC